MPAIGNRTVLYRLCGFDSRPATGYLDRFPLLAFHGARNRFVGIVTRVQIDGVMAQVDLQSGPHRVVSLMSAEAVRELGLEVGSLAVAVVKATTVIVETPRS